MHDLNTHCRACEGHIHVPLESVLLLIPPKGLARIVYTCPVCGLWGGRDVPDDFAEKLSRMGCPSERCDFAVPSQSVGGPPISRDDELDFHEDLAHL